MIPSNDIVQTINKTITLTTLIGKKFYATTCEFEIDLQFTSDTSTEQHVRAFKNIQYWFDRVLSQSIIYNIFGDEDTDIFETIENNLVFAPDEPHSYLILLLVHSKLNAIGGDSVRCSETRLKTYESPGSSSVMSYKFSGDAGQHLPSNEAWVGSPAFYDSPWWCRSDGSTIDVLYEEGDNVDNKPEILIDFEPKPAQTAKVVRPTFTVIK